jgi:tetratricopeptide (TPR) repeat protein
MRGPRFGGGVRCALTGRCVALTLAAFLVGGGAFGGQRAAATASLWERSATSDRDLCERLVGEAESALLAPGAGPGANARAEELVRQALAAEPDDFRALVLLADIESRAARPDLARAALERACPHAPHGLDATACWFRVGVERSRAGRLADALAAYERLLGPGDVADAALLSNAAEVLMALGRLPEAEERYREAIRADTPTSSGRIERPLSLVYSTYGLAVVLDRAGCTAAARETMARALALDPRLARLRAAERADADVFFVPDGDVYYYLGLAAEVAGHVDDAEAAFQEFLGRLPRSRWAARARAHLEGLVALERAGASPPRAGVAPSLRVLAAGTVLASGPVPAPLVDAAWREHPRLVDDCLADGVRAGVLAPRDGFRFVVELALDAHGVVTEAVAKAPATVDPSFARCVEAAVRATLRVPSPRQPRVTRARVELLVGVASGDAGGV